MGRCGLGGVKGLKWGGSPAGGGNGAIKLKYNLSTFIHRKITFVVLKTEKSPKHALHSKKELNLHCKLSRHPTSRQHVYCAFVS